MIENCLESLPVMYGFCSDPTHSAVKRFRQKVHLIHIQEIWLVSKSGLSHLTQWMVLVGFTTAAELSVRIVNGFGFSIGCHHRIFFACRGLRHLLGAGTRDASNLLSRY